MLDWLLSNSSYFGIILFLVLTGCGLPIPEEVAIIGAGVAAKLGSLNPWGAFAACLVGALAGDCVMYAIGYQFGHGLARKYPRFAQLLHADREATIEDMMRRHGLKVFFLARFVVGLRSPVYLTAGILRISFRRFLLFDAFCATVVVGTFYWLSYRYGEHIKEHIFRLEGAVTVAVVAAIIAAGVYFWRRHRQDIASAIEREPKSTVPMPPVNNQSPSAHLNGEKMAEQSARGTANEKDTAAKFLV